MFDNGAIKVAVVAGAATAGVEYFYQDRYGEEPELLKCAAIGGGASLAGGAISNYANLPPKAGPAVVGGLVFALTKKMMNEEDEGSFMKDFLIGTGVGIGSQALVNRGGDFMLGGSEVAMNDVY